MGMLRIARCVLVASLLIASWNVSAQTGPVEAPGQNPAPAADDWSFTIAPYIWLAGMAGSISVGNSEHSFDLKFSDVIESTRLALFGYGEVQWRRWGAGVDVFWVWLQNADEVEPLDLDARFDQVVWSPMLTYRVVDKPIGDDRASIPQRFTVDALVGTRRYVNDIRFALDDEPLDFNPKLAESRWESLVGARMNWSFAPRWSLQVRADAGGFGIGDAADLTLHATGLVAYSFVQEFALTAGYRVLQSATDRSDLDPKRRLLTRLHGFQFGALVSF